MYLQQIKDAVDRGETVHWASPAYTVKWWERSQTYNVVCTHNGSAIGLTHQDGVTMNGAPIQFFKAGDDDAQTLAEVYNIAARSGNSLY